MGKDGAEWKPGEGGSSLQRLLMFFKTLFCVEVPNTLCAGFEAAEVP